MKLKTIVAFFLVLFAALIFSLKNPTFTKAGPVCGASSSPCGCYPDCHIDSKGQTKCSMRCDCCPNEPDPPNPPKPPAPPKECKWGGYGPCEPPGQQEQCNNCGDCRTRSCNLCTPKCNFALRCGQSNGCGGTCNQDNRWSACDPDTYLQTNPCAAEPRECTGTIEGSVFDNTLGQCNNPQRNNGGQGGVTVVAQGSTQPGQTCDIFGSAVTDSQGRYSIGNLCVPSVYVIAANREISQYCAGDTVLLSTGDQVVRNINLGTAGVPWWQAIGGDIQTRGTIISFVPSRNYLMGNTSRLDGVAIYGSTTPTVTPGNISLTGWLANSDFSFRSYGFDYLRNLVPSQTNLIPLAGDIGNTPLSSGGVDTNGYFWFEREGNLTINSDVNISGGRKVVVFVNGGNLTINGDITVNSPGSDFFMVMVGKNSDGNGGNIIVGDSVTQLEGIFLTDNNFNTGESNQQLHVVGSVTAWGGVILDRDTSVTNNQQPSELFEFSPGMIMAYPQALARERIVWREVAP